MGFQQKQLQLTVAYITDQLKYADEREKRQTLTKSDKKWVSSALLQVLDPIQQGNPKFIVINSDNPKFKTYFEYLAENKIIFPENTTYIIARSGESHATKNHVKVEIYNRHRIKQKTAVSRMDELSEQLREMQMDAGSDDDVYSASSEESPSYTPYQQLITQDQYLPEQTRPISPSLLRAKL